MEQNLQTLIKENEANVTNYLESVLFELINNIAVAKRMTVSNKFNFKHLPKELHTRECCLAFIHGLEWSFAKVEREKEKYLKQIKGE